MKKLSLVFLLTLLVSSPLSAQKLDDKQLEAACEIVLASLDIDYFSVQIIDARAKGGTRSLLVGYNTARKKSEDKRLVELNSVFGVARSVNSKFDSNIDEISVVVGDYIGNAIGIFSVKTKATDKFSETKDIITYIKSWTVLLRNRNYFKTYQKKFDW